MTVDVDWMLAIVIIVNDNFYQIAILEKVDVGIRAIDRGICRRIPSC